MASKSPTSDNESPPVVETIKVKTPWRLSKFIHNLPNIPDLTRTPIEVTLEQFKHLEEAAKKAHITLETE